LAKKPKFCGFFGKLNNIGLSNSYNLSILFEECF
jgi:hypothetical protein